MSDDESADEHEIEVEAVENVLPESLLTVRQVLGRVDGVEFAEDNEDVYLSVRYPADIEQVVRSQLTRLSAQYPIVVDEMKTRETGMNAVRVYERE